MSHRLMDDTIVMPLRMRVDDEIGAWSDIFSCKSIMMPRSDTIVEKRTTANSNDNAVALTLANCLPFPIQMIRVLSWFSLSWFLSAYPLSDTFNADCETLHCNWRIGYRNTDVGLCVISERVPHAPAHSQRSSSHRTPRPSIIRTGRKGKEGLEYMLAFLKPFLGNYVTEIYGMFEVLLVFRLISNPQQSYPPLQTLTNSVI